VQRVRRQPERASEAKSEGSSPSTRLESNDGDGEVAWAQGWKDKAGTRLIQLSSRKP